MLLLLKLFMVRNDVSAQNNMLGVQNIYFKGAIRCDGNTLAIARTESSILSIVVISFVFFFAESIT